MGIEYAKRQFEIAKTYAMYWQAMALTGAAAERNISQGREPTEEEKARGETTGWRPLTKEEKIKGALDTMLNHIHNMTELNDYIMDQEKKNGKETT